MRSTVGGNSTLARVNVSITPDTPSSSQPSPPFMLTHFVPTDKDKTVDPKVLSEQNIEPGGNYKIGACGCENSTSGCEGSIELWDKGGANVVVAKVKYYSPHGTSYNAFSID